MLGNKLTKACKCRNNKVPKKSKEHRDVYTGWSIKDAGEEDMVIFILI